MCTPQGSCRPENYDEDSIEAKVGYTILVLKKVATWGKVMKIRKRFSTAEVFWMPRMVANGTPWYGAVLGHGMDLQIFCQR